MSDKRTLRSSAGDKGKQPASPTPPASSSKVVASSSKVDATTTSNVGPAYGTRSTKIRLSNKRAVYKSFRPLRKPNIEEALALIDKFGAVSQLPLAYRPRQEGAHVDPWAILAKKEAGAVARSLDGEVFTRMHANVAVANEKIEKLAGIVEKRRKRLGWMQVVEEMIDIYETYFNRRAALLKELDVSRAKEIIKRAEV